MLDFIFMYFFAYGLVTTFIYIISIYSMGIDDDEIFVPSDYSYDLFIKNIYNITSMNIFGCIVCSIILAVIFPLLAISNIVLWAFHIGRNN